MSARPSTSSPDRASGATYLRVPTKKPVRVMRRRERRRQLPHEVGHQRRSEGTGAVYVLGERFSVGPLEREVMQAFGLAVVVGAHDAGMLHPGAVSRFPQEAFDRRGVAPQARAQYLERTRPALGVLRPIHLGH